MGQIGFTGCKHHKHEHATMTTRAKVWLLDSQAVLYKVQVNNELNHKEEEFGQHDCLP